jgi:DNA-binding NtrC family response regulator
MDPSAEAALMQHTWPGNVRELSNVIERAVLLCTNGRITSSDLQLVPAAAPVFRDSQSDLPEFSRNDELERSHLVRALEETRWNLVSAANLLSVDTETLRERMDRHALYDSKG